MEVVERIQAEVLGKTFFRKNQYGRIAKRLIRQKAREAVTQMRGIDAKAFVLELGIGKERFSDEGAIGVGWAHSLRDIRTVSEWTVGIFERIIGEKILEGKFNERVENPKQLKDFLNEIDFLKVVLKDLNAAGFKLNNIIVENSNIEMFTEFNPAIAESLSKGELIVLVEAGSGKVDMTHLYRLHILLTNYGGMRYTPKELMQFYTSIDPVAYQKLVTVENKLNPEYRRRKDDSPFDFILFGKGYELKEASRAEKRELIEEQIDLNN